MAYLLIALGLGLLFWGGDLLVKGAVQLAQRWKVSTLVIGMTVVSSATSAPELLVSLQAAIEGHPDLALGNVVGSNIANISLILGFTALFYPLAIAEDTIRRNFPITLGASLLFWAFLALNGIIDRWEGLVLFLLLIGYTVTAIRRSRKQTKLMEAEAEVEARLPKVPMWRSAVLIILGVAALKFGADFLIQGSVTVALEWGIDERIISLSIVAVGTSVPELAASLVSAIRQEQDISLGNLLGSNLFNILSVIGLTGIIQPIEAQSASFISFDLPVMIGFLLLLFPMMVWITSRRIGRWEGLVLLMAYVGYLIYIF